MSRPTPPSVTTKSFFVKRAAKRPCLSRTTAATETTSMADRNVVFDGCDEASWVAAIACEHTSASTMADVTAGEVSVTRRCSPRSLPVKQLTDSIVFTVQDGQVGRWRGAKIV